MLVELVGDRFLRRMVRILVATALRLALLYPEGKCGVSQSDGGGVVGRLLRLVLENGDRSQAAYPAPPQGLAFLGVGFGNQSDITEASAERD